MEEGVELQKLYKKKKAIQERLVDIAQDLSPIYQRAKELGDRRLMKACTNIQSRVFEAGHLLTVD